MQSATSRQFAPIQLTAALVIAAGLGSGVLALGVTDNLPGQIRRPPVVIAPSDGRWSRGNRAFGQAGEGLVQPRYIESLLGPGATLAFRGPMIKGNRPIRQGERFVRRSTCLTTTTATSRRNTKSSHRIDQRLPRAVGTMDAPAPVSTHKYARATLPTSPHPNPTHHWRFSLLKIDPAPRISSRGGDANTGVGRESRANGVFDCSRGTNVFRRRLRTG